MSIVSKDLRSHWLDAYNLSDTICKRIEDLAPFMFEKSETWKNFALFRVWETNQEFRDYAKGKLG